YIYRLKQIDFNGVFDYSDEVIVEVTIPLEFALEQNFPNPFNPSTVIKYSIPHDGFVTLDVFNLLGEKVASLVNGIQKAGRYEINFDASNLASGIYVYNLKSGNFSSVRKMLLMR
ncbi:MAG: T9SS type A sorting domain-containing protein, partial [Ignavibacterium sp.]